MAEQRTLQNSAVIPSQVRKTVSQCSLNKISKAVETLLSSDNVMGLRLILSKLNALPDSPDRDSLQLQVSTRIELLKIVMQSVSSESVRFLSSSTEPEERGGRHYRR